MVRRRFFQRFGFTLIEFLIVLAIAGIVVALIMPQACGGGDASDAIRAAETLGFSNLRVIESSGCAGYHGCGQGDARAYEMTGVNAADKSVAFVVCCGAWNKGCTLRTK